MPRPRQTAVLCLSMLLCLSCQSQPKETVRPPGFTVVVFGDSTTAPRQVEGKALRVYADVLHDASRTKGLDARVINAGVPGDTTIRARRRFERDVLRHNPDVTVIQFGLNDSCIDVHRGKTKARVPQEEYEANLRHFVTALRRRGSHVILMTQNPMFWTGKLRTLYGKPPYDASDPWGFNLLNKDYAAAVRRIASELAAPLIDMYQYCRDYSESPERTAADLLLDGMHPNARGHAVIAAKLLEQIEPLIEGDSKRKKSDDVS